MEPGRAEIRAWLREILNLRGESPTALAKRAGLAQSTITRFLHSDDAPMLGLRSITKIAHAAGINPPGFGPIDPRGTAEPLRGGGMSEEAQAIEELPPWSVLTHHNAVSTWQLKTGALEHLGYLPGDVVAVDLNAQPAAGDVVCAQVYQWTEARATTVFRVYEPPYLIAASSRPGMLRPLVVDNDRVVVKGVVIASWRVRLKTQAPA